MFCKYTIVLSLLKTTFHREHCSFRVDPYFQRKLTYFNKVFANVISELPVKLLSRYDPFQHYFLCPSLEKWWAQIDMKGEFPNYTIVSRTIANNFQTLILLSSRRYHFGRLAGSSMLTWLWRLCLSFVRT